MPSSLYSIIFSTFPAAESAKEVAEILVKEALVACANISSPIESIYNWQGKMEREIEVQLWCKTQKVIVPAVMARIAALHPYECPAIVELPILSGYPPYLDWIKSQTSTPDNSR